MITRAICGVLAFSVLLISGGRAVEIKRESFEGSTAPLYSTTGLISSPDRFMTSQSDFWTATDGSNIVSASSAGSVPPAIYSGENGNRYWAGQDLDAADNNTDTVVFGPIPISGFLNLRFDGLFAADGLLGGNAAQPRYDLGEGLEVAWSIDGGTYTTALAFKAENNAGDTTNVNIRKDTNLNGTGDGAILGPVFSSHGFTIGSTGTNLTIRVTGISSGSQEEFAFDNLTISGDAAPSNLAPTVGSFVAADVGEPQIGNTSYSFTVTYGDDSGVDATTIDASDVTVNGIAMTSGTTSDPTGAPLTATYTFTPPGGSWDAADNGTYTISAVANQVGDNDGTQLFVAAGTIGTFTVAATNTTPVVSSVLATAVTNQHQGAASYSFDVTYTDVGGINASSIGLDDVTVTGPGGALTVTGGSTSDSNGSPVTATYTVTPPGDSWDPADDNNTYTIGIVASQIFDLAGASVAANASQATFSVDSTCAAFESFESAAPNYDTGLITSPDSFYSTTSDFWTVTDGSNIVSGSSAGSVPPATYSGEDGSRYWAGQDLDEVDNNSDTVVFGPIPISGFTGLSFSGLFAADGLLSGNASFPRFDTGEGLEVAWSIDGGAYTTALAYKASGALNSYIKKDTNLDGTGDGTILSSTFASDGFNIGSTGSTISIRITGISNGSQEEFAFDALKISGTPSVVNQAPTASSFVAADVGESEIGNTSYSFTVTYSDDSGVDATTIDASDVTVNGIAMTSGTTSDATGSPVTATYTFTPPGGSWDAADNGTYTITAVTGQVGDNDGTQLFVAAGSIGTFEVAATNTLPVVSSVFAPHVTNQHQGATSYSFNVTYTDIGGIDVSSIGAADVTVTGPGGALTVTGGSTSDSNGSPVTATYTVTPPGGSWDPSDDSATYTIGIVGSQVLDVASSAVAANANQATFSVDSTCAARESFESASPNYDTGLVTAADQFYSSTSDFWTATDGSNIVSASSTGSVPPATYSGEDGTRYWAGQDLDAVDNNSDTVVLGPIPISGFTGLSFSGLFAADGLLGGDQTKPRFDSGEGLEVAWSIDGGTYTTALAFKASGATNSDIKKDTDFDGVGDDAILGSTFSSHGFSIASTGAAISIRITGISDGSQEEFAFDDLKISGTPPKPEIDVQRPAATSIADGGSDALGNQAYGSTLTFNYTIDNSGGLGLLTIQTGGVTATGLSNVSGFAVNTSLPLVVNAGATSTLSIQFQVDAAGAFGLDLDIASNDPDENPYDIALSGTATTLQSWRVANFSAADLADPTKEATVWGADANPDRDSKTNLFEFLHGCDPNVFDTTPAITIGSNGNKTTYTFKKRDDLTGTTFKVQVASSPGGTFTDLAQTSSTPLGGGFSTVVYEDTTDVTPGSPRVAKIVITQP